jgi:hypothetical protein
MKWEGHRSGHGLQFCLGKSRKKPEVKEQVGQGAKNEALTSHIPSRNANLSVESSNAGWKEIKMYTGEVVSSGMVFIPSSTKFVKWF